MISQPRLDRMGKAVCFGYCRVSKQRQADEGCSLEEQESRIRAYAEYKWPGEELRGIEIHQEIDESSGDEFLSRPVAYELWSRLQPGDHFVVMKADRMSRNLVDTCGMLRKFEERQVQVHLLDINVDTTTPVGEMIVKVLMIFKEMELATIRENTCKALAWRRAEQRPIGSIIPYGYTKIVDGKDKFFVPDAAMQRQCKGISLLWHAGLAFKEILALYERWGIVRRQRGGKPGPWTIPQLEDGRTAYDRGFPIHGQPPREELKLDPAELKGFPLDRVNRIVGVLRRGKQRA